MKNYGPNEIILLYWWNTNNAAYLRNIDKIEKNRKLKIIFLIFFTDKLKLFIIYFLIIATSCYLEQDDNILKFI